MGRERNLPSARGVSPPFRRGGSYSSRNGGLAYCPCSPVAIESLSDCASVANTPGGCVKFSEGLVTCGDAGTTQIMVETRQYASINHKLAVRRYEPFRAVGICDMGQGVHGGRGITLGIVAHLVRPPGYVFEHRWMKKSQCVQVKLVDRGC